MLPPYGVIEPGMFLQWWNRRHYCLMVTCDGFLDVIQQRSHSAPFAQMGIYILYSFFFVCVGCYFEGRVVMILAVADLFV